MRRSATSASLSWAHAVRHSARTLRIAGQATDSTTSARAGPGAGGRAAGVTKALGHFPNDDAVVKLLWLAIIELDTAHPGRMRWNAA
jgi:transposase-like protein